MSGHTPGPWTWEDESGDWPDNCLVGDGGDYVLQWDMDLGFQFGKPADRPLIATSPDLLAACKALVGSVTQETERGRVYALSELSSAVDAAKAAIAKAERP